jgi:hypothetical protein
MDQQPASAGLASWTNSLSSDSQRDFAGLLLLSSRSILHCHDPSSLRSILRETLVARYPPHSVSCCSLQGT